MIPIYITKERTIELVNACRNAGIPCPELEYLLQDFDEFIEGAVFYKEEREEKHNYYCPKCGHKGMNISKGGYIEAGEWNGNYYEHEESVQGYACPTCGFCFYAG